CSIDSDLCLFFFSSRRRHTRFSRDWSSDVCSSDLGNILVRYRDANSLVSQIRNVLRALPAADWPTSEALAQSLCMSPSTLRRRLLAEGVQYQGIKDSLREEQATRWLAEPTISYPDIAERLGFADVSSFYKAFRKWTGTNPGHYRQLILGEQ